MTNEVDIQAMDANAGIRPGDQLAVDVTPDQAPGMPPEPEEANNEHEFGSPVDIVPDFDPVEDLPVTLEFLLTEHRVMLAEMRNMAPGVTLNIQVDLDKPIVISANGAKIGIGHLVQVGAHIGIQISQWPTVKADRNA
jgi:flagellar motor switch/type III secretory pathway protein FliN